MHPVEDLGLVKMDLLGQRALTVVQETVEDVKRVRGVEVDPYRLPDGDPQGEASRAERAARSAVSR